MAKITISYDSPGGDTFQGKIGSKVVLFSGTAKKGTADVTLTAGDYFFAYFIEGTPGADYTIKIEGSTPAKTVKDKITATGPFKGQALGAIPFTAPAASATTAGAKKAGAKKAGAKKAAAKKASAKKAGHK